jgi:hypothetical protein
MPSASTVSITSAGKLSDGREVAEYQLTNDGGTAASILTLGATMRACLVADALGTYEDVVLGFDTAEEYLPSAVNPANSTSTTPPMRSTAAKTVSIGGSGTSMAPTPRMERRCGYRW